MNKTLFAFIAHALALIVLIGVFGALSLNKSAAEGSIKFTGEIERNATLHILENDTAKEMGYLDHLISAFNEKYAEYGVKAVDANMDQYTDLEKDGPYGYGPDVLYQANDALMKYTDGKHIQPLPAAELECYTKISNNAWSAYTAEYGSENFIFGVPVNIQGPLFYYRKDTLPADWRSSWDKDKNGVPDMVEYWVDTFAYSKKIKSESGGKKYGYMKSLFDPYFASGYLFSYGAYIFGNGGTDTSDIGISNGNAYKGAQVIKQLATAMSEDCIDDTVTVNAYSMIANGTYFATMTTPDVYTLFIKELTNEYVRKEGLSRREAEQKAKENLVVADIPKLPESGNLEDKTGKSINSVMMGGINGYAISSYTKYPNAALAFVDFATSYDMILKRNQLLGIAPARQDVAEKVGGLSETVNHNLSQGKISVMPSVRAVAQIWTPLQTFFSDLAKDAFRTKKEQKYISDESFKKALEKVDEQIYAAIHTLA